MLEELTRWALDSCGFKPGERVLDLGCGCGATTLEIAKRVGPEGRVSGFDLSRLMLELAAQRAREAGLPGLHLAAVDVEHGDLGSSADAAFSRFGLMFFLDPAAGFGNIGRALRPAGRLQFLCWSTLERNPFFTATMVQFARSLGLPPPAPGTPGPFGLADEKRTRAVLVGAGFEDVEFVEKSFAMRFSSTLEAFHMQLDLSAALRTQIESLGPEVREELQREVEAALAPYATAGRLEIPATAWWVGGAGG